MRHQRRAGLSVLAVAVALWSVAAANAQDPRGVSKLPVDDPVVIELTRRTEAFLDRVSGVDVEQAFRDLVKGGPLTEKREQLSELAREAQKLHVSYGAFKGVDRVAVKTVGRDLVLLEYLYKCERFPIVWRIGFYREQTERRFPDVASTNGAGWNVVFVRFDNDLDPLFDEAP